MSDNKNSLASFKIPWWVRGDWNGLFGLGTNVLLNVIVLSGLCLSVVNLPTGTVFGRILPALGVALPLGNIWYAFLARRLARRERRDNVTALPYGPSVPHTFIVVFVVMLPTYLSTNDALAAWRAGIAWCFIIGLIVLLGALIGPWIRKYLPRAALLGALAGMSITFISMNPVGQMWRAPWVAFIAFGFIMVGWFSGQKMPFDAPVGLVAVFIATLVAWVATLAGWANLLEPSAVAKSLEHVSLYLPIPGIEVFHGLSDVAPLLASAIPLGIYNFSEGMTNIESAAAAGDKYSIRSVLAADGIGAILGSILGSPFPPAVYVGHPGWKAVGGRIGYSIVTGVVVAAVCFSGLVGIFLQLFPSAALVPVLLYIGLVIGAQAFDVSPKRYYPAIVLAMIPSIAEWATGQIENTLSAAGTSVSGVGIPALLQAGVIYDGIKLLGQGAILVGIILGAIACFVIDRRFYAAAAVAGMGGVLSFVGLINAYQIGINANSGASIGYLLLALLLVGFGYKNRGQEAPIDDNLLFVNGTLMRGLEIASNLNGATFLESVKTARRYRLHSINDVHPGMYEISQPNRDLAKKGASQQAGEELGVCVAGELYEVTPEVLLRVIEGEPAGLYRGSVTLEDGRVVPGILYPRELAVQHPDISSYGGWREYCEQQA